MEEDSWKKEKIICFSDCHINAFIRGIQKMVRHNDKKVSALQCTLLQNSHAIVPSIMVWQIGCAATIYLALLIISVSTANGPLIIAILQTDDSWILEV